MKVLIVGLGNPILGDDGVGWVVAKEVEQQLTAHQLLGAADNGAISDSSIIEIDYLSVGGLALMERMVGYDQVILIDALGTGHDSPGAICILPLDSLPDRALGHLGSAHDTTLLTALELGRSMGAQLPESITVVGIEAKISFDFTENLSAPVAAAVPRAVQTVLDLAPIQK